MRMIPKRRTRMSCCRLCRGSMCFMTALPARCVCSRRESQDRAGSEFEQILKRRPTPKKNGFESLWTAAWSYRPDWEQETLGHNGREGAGGKWLFFETISATETLSFRP